LRLDNPRAKSVLAAVYLKDRYLYKPARELIAVAKELLGFDQAAERGAISRIPKVRV
jgi:hypothetical protein